MLCIRWAANAARPVDADIILAFHWHFNGLEPIRNIQYDFLGKGCWGNRSQEQTRIVCDAAPAINANADSMRKRSAGHAMNLLRMVSPA